LPISREPCFCRWQLRDDPAGRRARF